MKLRNKKTGEVGELLYNPNIIDIYFVANDKGNYSYNSLTELNEEWEDYEEPKEKYNYYYLNCDGGICCYCDTLEKTKGYREIGNYFETEEEAKKAVEKLKAWKKLKDKGFERVFRLGLSDALCGGKAVAFELLIDDKDSIEDIKLLFGGEE